MAKGGEKMKKLTTLTVMISLFVFSALPALAQYGIDYGTLTGLGTKDLRAGVMGIVNALLGFLGIIAIVIILWGGFRWMTSAGNEEKVGEAKKVITAGIIGLIIIFISYAIAAFVIKELVSATGANPVS